MRQVRDYEPRDCFEGAECKQRPERTPSTTLREAERTLILGALEGTGWLVGGPYGAAARLGMKRTTLIARMKKHGILRHPDENRNRAVLDDSPSRSL
jgi:transcriptional regulator with GAF, ATPase, and Fis domain